MFLDSSALSLELTSCPSHRLKKKKFNHDIKKIRKLSSDGCDCMAFRDHLTHARLVQEETSLIHGVWNYSRDQNHPMLLFENISESKGQRIAVNMLTRDRLCEAIGIEPRADRRIMASKNALALGTPQLQLVDGLAPLALINLPNGQRLPLFSHLSSIPSTFEATYLSRHQLLD